MVDLPNDVISKIGNRKLEEIILKVKYKNWRGEIGIRNIIPIDVYYGKTDYQKVPLVLFEDFWMLKILR